MQTLSVGECIRFGWATFKKRPGMLIGAFVLAMLIMGISSTILDTKNMQMSLLSILMSVASGIIGIFVEMGLVTFALKAHDSIEDAKIGDLWNPAPFWRYLGGQILTGIIFVIGLILLIVPGIIAAAGFLFTSYLVIDRGMGPIEALKGSWHLTKGNRWRILLLLLAIIALNIIGLVLLIVGLVVTIPVTMLALVHAYRTLSGRADASTIATAAETITIS